MKRALFLPVPSVLLSMLSLSVALLAGPPAQARVIYVDRGAAGEVHDGASWATAFAVLRDAVSVAAKGDEVWVAKGTFPASLDIPEGVALYGGFAGTETAASQRDWKANRTVLDGGGFANVLGCGAPDIVVDGFTIRNGITGVAVGVGPVTLRHNLITGNTQEGVSVMGGTVHLLGNTICANGTGVRLDHATATEVNDTVTGNVSGLDVSNSTLALTNSLVARNSGVGIRSAWASTITASHNDVYGNRIRDYEGPDPTGTNGNISADPKLSSPFLNVHIQPGSPCIDAGDSTAVPAGERDIDAQPRIVGAGVDIGADESDGTAWPPLVIHVTAAGNDAEDGLTWASARGTVSAALAVASSRDEVWVAKGTYTKPLRIPQGVALYGGFAGSEASRKERDWKVNASVLDGGGSTSIGVEIRDEATVLDGFTLQNGGTGVLVYDGSVTVSHCRIHHMQNEGIYVSAGAAAIADCAIYGNDLGAGSFGIITLNNCTVTGNNAGITADAGEAAIANCIVAFNQTGITEGSFADALQLSHNDVFGNATTNYKGRPDPSGTGGNISKDPLLVNATGGDVHLQAGSPCIDAGDDAAVSPGETDLDGAARRSGAHVDIGAYEFAVAGGFTMVDAAKCLKIGSGLLTGTPDDVNRLNVAPGAVLDIQDALRLARKAAGLDANP